MAGFFTDKDGVPSMKRLCAFIGWLAIVVGYLYCVFSGLQMPSFTEFLAGCCVALLGTDAAKEAISNLSTKNKE